MKTAALVKESIEKALLFIEQFSPKEFVDITIAPYRNKPNVRIHLELDAFKRTFAAGTYRIDGSYLQKNLFPEVEVVAVEDQKNAA